MGDSHGAEGGTDKTVTGRSSTSSSSSTLPLMVDVVPDALLDFHREMVAAFLPFDIRVREQIDLHTQRFVDPDSARNTIQQQQQQQEQHKGDSDSSDVPVRGFVDSGTPPERTDHIPEDGEEEATNAGVNSVIDKEGGQYLPVSTLAALSKLEFEARFDKVPKPVQASQSIGQSQSQQQKGALPAEMEHVRNVVRRGGPSHALNSNGDGLCIASHGLGLSNVILFFLQLYAHNKNLVLLLNTSPSEVEFFREGLMRIRAMRGENDVLDINPTMLRNMDTGTSPADRKRIYLSGGVVAVASRVLIVDLLNAMFPADLLTGVLINHAHQISDSSLEAFILTLIRERNKPSFFKAFSERPERFAHGSIWRLEESMRVLYMRHVFLWPRFHVSVSHSLSKNGSAIVTDVSVPMTRLMKDVQEALLDCMKECISELKRSSALLDPDDLTIENALFRNFTTFINQKFEHIAHRVSAKTRTLIRDLSTLRATLFYLLTYDSVTLNEHLDNLRIASLETINSTSAANQWLLLDASHAVFESAKRRVYYNDPEFPGIVRLGIPKGIVPVLEEQPKWKALKQIITQIDEDRSNTDLEPNENGPILIMVDGDRACTQIRDYLSGMVRCGETIVTDPYFPVYFNPSRAALSQPNEKQRKRRQPKFSTPGSMEMMYSKLSRHFKWKANVTNVATNIMPKSNNGSKQGTDNTTVNYGKISKVQNLATNKRRRIRGGGKAGSTAGSVHSKPLDDLLTESSNVSAALKTTEDNDERDRMAKDLDLDIGALSDADEGGEESLVTGNSIDDGFLPIDVDNEDGSNNDSALDADFLENFELLSSDSMIIIRPFAETSASIRSNTSVGGDIDARLLDDLRPRWVIMLDANVGFVRRLEVYKALNSGLTVNVYFMTYVDSVEEQLYLSSLRRENFAFQKLINQKGNMVVPIDQDGRTTHQDDSDMWRNLDRRIAAQRSGFDADNTNDIVVDVREFRSRFPFRCHKAKLRILPSTLEVGDYVLSPMICVERKSVPDLLQSFRSGRLYTQCEAMTLHYQMPVLMIEFDKEKGFMLLGDQDLGAEIRAHDVTSRISLLLLHFPKLRVVWAMTCDAGAEIFVDLKRNQEPPTVEAAQAVGVESKDLVDSVYAITPSDVLRSLPGITDKNYKHVMSKVTNLAALVEMSLEQLSTLVGPENGRKLFEFINLDSREPQK